MCAIQHYVNTVVAKTVLTSLENPIIGLKGTTRMLAVLWARPPKIVMSVTQHKIVNLVRFVYNFSLVTLQITKSSCSGKIGHTWQWGLVTWRNHRVWLNGRVLPSLLQASSSILHTKSKERRKEGGKGGREGDRWGQGDRRRKGIIKFLCISLVYSDLHSNSWVVLLFCFSLGKGPDDIMPGRWFHFCRALDLSSRGGPASLAD